MRQLSDSSESSKVASKIIVGVDEVGRGALAGPVVAAAVCFHPDFFVSKETAAWVRGVKDSKQLSAEERNYFSKKILSFCLASSVVRVSEKVIDEINIHQATLRAMRNAVKNIFNSIDPISSHVIVDGKFLIPKIHSSQEAIVKADEKIFSVSAASIVAKVFRDSIMIRFSKQFPEYGFEVHKGYGTLAHRTAVIRFGLSKIHRKTFCKNKDSWIQ